jgi:hypothetical protein
MALTLAHTLQGNMPGSALTTPPRIPAVLAAGAIWTARRMIIPLLSNKKK